MWSLAYASGYDFHFQSLRNIQSTARRATVRPIGTLFRDTTLNFLSFVVIAFGQPDDEI